MARLLGPDSGFRLVYTAVGASLRSAVGKTAVVYADEGAGALADIAAYDGTSTPGGAVAESALTVDENSLLPLFWFPDGVDTVYVRVGSGPVVAVTASVAASSDMVQDAQDAANAALTSANGKNKNYYQAAAPTGGTYVDGDLWFDTDAGNKMYIRQGGAWVDAQDALVSDAYETAMLAQTSADGKTTTYIQAAAPTGGTYVVGDTWINTTGGANSLNTWNGSAWTLRTFGSGAFGADSVTSTAIADGAVDSTQIADNAITTAKVLAGQITASQLASGAVTTAKLDAEAVTATKMKVGTITALSGIIASIDAGTITVGTMNAVRIGGNQMQLDATGTYGIRIDHTSAGTAAELATFDTGSGGNTFYTQKGSLGAVRNVTTSYGLVGNYSGMIQNAAVPTLTVKGWSGQTTNLLEVQDNSAVVRVAAPPGGGLVVNNGAALATSATTGFVSIPFANGVPAGTPATAYRPTGSIAMAFGNDNRLYAYTGGTWKSVLFS